MIRANELDTVHILRTLRNTSRVYHNTVAAEVLALERRAGGATFDDVRAFYVRRDYKQRADAVHL